MIKQDLQTYLLNITITRHGPKEGFGGSLTAKGKESVLEYYEGAYDSSASRRVNQRSLNRRLVSSPIHRAIETAYIYKGVIEKYDKSFPLPVEEDERLSEKDLIAFIHQLPAEQKDDWFRYWYYSASGGKIISDFCSWLLEQINRQKQTGGVLQIDAFSHGPIMAGFILRIEDILGTQLLSPVASKERRLNFARLFSERSCVFNYLSNVAVELSSADPDNLKITIKGKSTVIPLSVLADI